MFIIVICPKTEVLNLPPVVLACPSGPVQDIVGTGLPKKLRRKAVNVIESPGRTISDPPTGLASGGSVIYRWKKNGQ